MAVADHRHVIAALRRSHDRLVSIVEKLPAGGETAPSYCDDWTIAQVLSHLGSGAEIGLSNVDAALAGNPPPAREGFVEIWDRWNALEPDAMTTNAIMADQQYVSRWENLDDATLESFAMPNWDGTMLDASGAVAMRLSEHAIHTWDIEVMGDAEVGLAENAVSFLADVALSRLARLARGTKPEAVPTAIAITTADPERVLSLEIADAVTIGNASDAPSRLSIPTEALIRLAYGRMDIGHTPESVELSGVLTLDDLRALYPGF